MTLVGVTVWGDWGDSGWGDSNWGDWLGRLFGDTGVNLVGVTVWDGCLG